MAVVMNESLRARPAEANSFGRVLKCNPKGDRNVPELSADSDIFIYPDSEVGRWPAAFIWSLSHQGKSQYQARPA